MSFSGNKSLLVSAAMLQDYLVDKDTGLPLVGGIVTLYQDNNRSVLKNWYEQQGASPSYTYVALPNPMTLSSVGTIQDLSGNDVIPFYYPYDESAMVTTPQSYYITVQNSNGELQFTRSNFPFVPPVPSTPSEPALINLLINNCFWRNISNATNTAFDPNALMTASGNSIVINSTTLYYLTLAPSQHDGHIMPDINYYKNVVDGTEMMTFKTFSTDNILMDDVTPELYLDISVTGAGSSTQRYIQIPLQLHVHSLSGYTNGTFTLQAMSISGTNKTITVGIFQFLGTGVTSPAVATQSITLGAGWTKYPINLPIPTAQGTTLSVGGDDALYIQIGFPVGDAFEMAIALPEFYLGSPPATNSFQTYDVVNAVASSPRTGDTRTSLNTFSPYGWVPANDGTIGSAASMTTTRSNADTWPLYNLIYTTVNNTFAPVTGGRTSPGNTTAAAYTDFSTNKAMALTKALGRALIGLPTSSSFAYANTGIITIADTTLYYVGSPVILSNLSAGTPFSANTVYYVIPISGTTFSLATSYANALAGTAITGSSAGTGTVNFALGGAFGEDQHTQLEIEIATHSHAWKGGGHFLGDTSGSAINSAGVGAGITTQTTTATDGSSAPFNIVQPSTYLNVFLKL